MQTIKNELTIIGEKVLLVGFRGFQNLGDELILLGNIKLLQQQKKEIYIISQQNNRLKTFLSQEIDCSSLHFIDELPRGFRSSIKYFKKNGFKQLKTFFDIDTIILGGGEILTEESPHSYYYRFRSIRPSFLLGKKLYIMGGIQTPKKWRNKILFKWICRKTTAFYCRDFEEEKKLKEIGMKQVEFFMDTSYFAFHDWRKYKHQEEEKYLMINLNSKGEQFLEDLITEIKPFIKQGYTIYFVPVYAGAGDDDAKYYTLIQEKISYEHLKLFTRTENIDTFLHKLGGAKKVISTRLHLFLISSFIGIDTVVFPYQKKINKMKEVLQKIIL